MPPWLKTRPLGKITRSLGKIKEIPRGCLRGQISCSFDLKIGQSVCLEETSGEFEYGPNGKKLGH